MSMCDNCLLYQPEIRHCKIGKPVGELFCNSQMPEKLDETAQLNQLERGLAKITAEDKPLQIGVPYKGHRKIADMTGLDRGRVGRAIDRLVGAGVIGKDSRGRIISPHCDTQRARLSHH